MPEIPLRFAVAISIALSVGWILADIGKGLHADSAQILSWYAGFLPLWLYVDILLFSSWLGECLMESWGLWQARRDLSLVAKDLAILESWRLGGEHGVRLFLFLFWASIGVFSGFGLLFFVSGVSAFLRAYPSWIIFPLGYALDTGLAFLLPGWAGYGAFLLWHRRRHPVPPIPEDGRPKVASLSAWRKEQLLHNKEEAIAFLAWFHEACPEFVRPKAFPWKILLFTLPEFSWHFYLWAGGQARLPLAASAAIGLLGAGAVALSLWRLIPWSIAESRAILHPEDVSCCRYLPVLRLRDLAERLAS